MLQACLDDSGRDTDSPFFLIAGYFGAADDFVDLGHAWNRLLAKEPKLNYIKGYEAFGLSGEFTDWGIEERDRRLLEFVPLIAKYSNKGIAFVIDKEFWPLIKNLRDDDEISFKDPDEFAFVMSLSTLSQLLPDLGATSIDVVFDNNLAGGKQARRAYRTHR